MDEADAHTTETTRSNPHMAFPAATEQSTQRLLDDSFASFYRMFTPTLVAFLRWQGVPLRDAADLAQETMTEAYRNWAKIRHPKAWVRRVACRLWARRLAGSVEDSVADVPEPVLLRGLTDVTEWEQRHDVLRILNQLPSRQRQVLAWSLDGYTPSEIAEELRMTPEAVRASLYKARRAVASG